MLIPPPFNRPLLCSCSSHLASAPSSAACQANGLGPAPGGADGLQLRAMQLAQLQGRAKQAQHGYAAPAALLQQQALPPITSAPLCYPGTTAAESNCCGGALSQGGALTAEAAASWGQRCQQEAQLMPAPLLQPQGDPFPSAVFQAASLGGALGGTHLPAAGSDVLGAGCSSLPLFQGSEGWGVPHVPLASLVGSHRAQRAQQMQQAQQAQQAALHTATQALLMHQLPPHLQLQALLQQHQQAQLQNAAAGLWQQPGAHGLRHAHHGQASQPRQVCALIRLCLPAACLSTGHSAPPPSKYKRR